MIWVNVQNVYEYYWQNYRDKEFILGNFKYGPVFGREAMFQYQGYKESGGLVKMRIQMGHIDTEDTWRFGFIPYREERGQYHASEIAMVVEANHSGEFIKALSVSNTVKEYQDSLDMLAVECIPAILAIGFLNVQNISLVDEPLTRQQRRKREREGGVIYKVLSVSGGVTGKPSGSSSHPQDLTRLHLCRGHFKTYSPERPLFGKYSGTFWVNPHTRGNKENGIVIKDYEVKP